MLNSVIASLAFPAPPPEYGEQGLREADRQNFLTSVKIDNGKSPFSVEALHYRNPNKRHQITVLYFHGNAEDIGLLYPHICMMGRRLHCDVFAAEYPGYGRTHADSHQEPRIPPTEKGVLDMAEAAWKHLTTQLKLEPQQILVVGRSLGSGPATHVVSHLEPERQPRGLVLLSPLASGANAISPHGWLPMLGGALNLDIFPNLRKVPRIHIPTLIVHGTEDEVVKTENGKMLYAKLQERGLAAKPLWLKGRGHNDMPEEECSRAMLHFVEQLLLGEFETEDGYVQVPTRPVEPPSTVGCFGAGMGSSSSSSASKSSRS